MKYLAEGLAKLSKLQIIDLSHNELVDKKINMKYLAEGISKLSNIQK